MTIETDDIQALDLLSSPSASIVYLERSINEKRRDLQRIVSETCGQAVFWPSTEGAAADSVSSNRRQLMGEIHLRGNLQPSSAVPGLVIEVRPFLAALASNLFCIPVCGSRLPSSSARVQGVGEGTSSSAGGRDNNEIRCGAATENLHTCDVRNAQCGRRLLLSC